MFCVFEGGEAFWPADGGERFRADLGKEQRGEMLYLHSDSDERNATMPSTTVISQGREEQIWSLTI